MAEQTGVPKLSSPIAWTLKTWARLKVFAGNANSSWCLCVGMSVFFSIYIECNIPYKSEETWENIHKF